MENIEFYAYPTLPPAPLEVAIEINPHNPLQINPQDQEQLNKDWVERGYARSSPIGTLSDVFFDKITGKTKLVYHLTEYKIYSGIAFPALPDTEKKLSPSLKESMRASANGCVVETADGKIIIQRRKEGLSTGGMLDSGAAGMMVYNTITRQLDWQEQALEKLVRELSLTPDAQLSPVTPTAVFSSRGPVNIPAPKGYFIGCYSGMVSCLIKVSYSYDELLHIFDPQQIHEIIGINKNDLADFIVDHTTVPKNRGFNGDGCASLLSTLPPPHFYQTIERINSKEKYQIRFGKLRQGKFLEQKI